MRNKKLFFLLIVFIILTALFYSRLPHYNIYPPLLSKTYPLGTPMAFWSSALGMRRLAGSILWVQAMQYYGTRTPNEGKSNEFPGEIYRGYSKSGPTLYPELKNHWQQIIRIDPYMASAYLTGPVTLGWNLRRYEEAMVLVNEGIKAVESIMQRQKKVEVMELTAAHPLLIGRGSSLKELRNRLYMLKTVIVFLRKNKFTEAIPHLEKIAAKEDTPEEISIMLAQIYTENGLYEKALNLWINLYETTARESTRQLAIKYLQRIEAEIIPSD